MPVVAANLDATPDDAIDVIREMVAEYRERVNGGRVRIKRGIPPYSAVSPASMHMFTRSLRLHSPSGSRQPRKSPVSRWLAQLSSAASLRSGSIENRGR